MDKAGHISYQMLESTAQALLKARKNGDKNMHPMDYLVKVVNEEYGLLYHCDEVVIKLDKA